AVPMYGTQAEIDGFTIVAGGSRKGPVLFDDFLVSRKVPRDLRVRPLLPQADKKRQFRFAAVGDPQFGFGGGGLEYDAEKLRIAIREINDSGAALSILLGDYAHKAEETRESFELLAKVTKRLAGPCHAVRGNHDPVDLYRKHVQKKLDYSFKHKGVRFVMIDAPGKVGLSADQLSWIESELREADRAGEEIIVCSHVSAWESNERGRSAYNRIGPGSDRLRALLAKYRVLLYLSGHYHRGFWHHEEKGTHFLILGGTALVHGGPLGWCV
ncbi:unnamed protein product, partial [marine sediment metagenome]